MKIRPYQVAIGLGLILLMTFMFVKTNVVQSGVHNRFSADLHQLKTIDATIGKDILESRFGLTNNYDALQSRIDEIGVIQRTLRQVPQYLTSEETERINGILGDFGDLQTQKDVLIGQFKARNAIFNDSLRYFPVAADNLRHSRFSLTASETTRLNDLERSILTYYLSADPASRVTISNRLDQLESELDARPASADRLVITSIFSHARAILQLKPELDDLVKQAISLPTSEKSEEVIGAYDSFYERAMQQAAVYRLILYISSIFLLAYIGLIIFKLKSATVSLEEDLIERKRSQMEHEVISEVIQGVTVTSNLDELLKLIHKSLGKLLNAENCFVALYNRETDLLNVPFLVDKYDTPAAPAKLGTGLTAYVLRQNRPVKLTVDAIKALSEKGEVTIIGTLPAIWLGVPLRTPAGIIGVVVVQHYENVNCYDERDLGNLSAVGDQIALAIERKRVEEELRISEEQHRLMFESNPQPVFVVDFETLSFLAVNQAAINLYGYSRDEFSTTISIRDLTLPENDTEFTDRLNRARNGHAILLESSRHQRKDGSVIDIEITQHEITFASRRASIVRINDVSLRRRLEAESKVISEIIEGVASTTNLDDLLGLIHRSIGRILYAENCFVALHDPLTDQIGFEFWADKFDPIPAPASVGKSFSNFVLRSGEALLLSKDKVNEMIESGLVSRVGSASASWLGVPLKTPERTIGVLVVQHYEKEGVYSHQDLAFLISVGDQIAIAIERKRSEEQLLIFNDKLQRSNRELQDFAYVASHDLQEPLRKVQAFSDRLKTKYSDKLEGEGLDYLERMRGAANRMQLLIQDLLTFSRVATNARPFAKVDLKEITREVLSDLEVKIEETGASVEIGELPTVDADPLQMRQLLQNLIGNALKFRKSSQSPIINIFSQSLPSNRNGSRGKFQLVVKDNGIGFDEKYTDKIFAVFQRLHGRTEYEGSGVGLSICRKIAERHNGHIAANSTLHEGSTFIVTLPVRQAVSEVN